jgi:3-phenylpropionate/trans-cinnamate dioxygenase ferredoxin reductase subunit
VTDRKNARVVVVGAGQAGFSACAKLRKLGHTGPLTLIGEEAYAPYQRPPLSKGFLLGDVAREQLFLRPSFYYEEQSIDLRTGSRVARIDRRTKAVHVADDTTYRYDVLILATGSRPRLLPDSLCPRDLKGVYYVRSLVDVDALSCELQPGRRLLVVGGGYIGLEIAAAASKLGVKVTLIEATDRILQRVASPETSNYLHSVHLAHGVDVRQGCALRALASDKGRVSRAELSDGTTLEIDFAVVGIGILPNQELASDAGLLTDNGICVDAFCRTSDPDIVASGDCASFPFREERIRLESVGNAVEQSEAVAEILMGRDLPYDAKPWFWSDQYDIKLQIAGLSAGHDSIVVRRGTTGALSSVWYFRGKQLLAVDALNDSRAYMLARRCLGAGQSPDPQALAVPEVDLRSLLKA